jgi:hypothetical protein
MCNFTTMDILQDFTPLMLTIGTLMFCMIPVFIYMLISEIRHPSKQILPPLPPIDKIKENND